MYNSPIITNKGYNAISYFLEREQKLDIKRMLLSSTDYSSYDLPNIDISDFNITLPTAVSVSKEKVVIGKGSERRERYALKSYGIFTNETVLVAFNIKSVALTCLDENGLEIILAIITATAPFENIQTKDTPLTFSYIISLIFDGSDEIQVKINPEGIPTLEMLEKKWGKEDKEVYTRSMLPLADGTHNKIDDVYYIKDTNTRVVEQMIRDDGNGYIEHIYTDETTEPIPTNNSFYRDKNNDRFYKAVANSEPRAVKEHELVDALPVKGTYINDTLVVLNSSSTYTLYKANATETSGYTAITNFHIITEEPSDPVNYDYYYNASTDELVRYEYYIWQRIEVNIVEKLPKNDPTTDGKYYKEYVVKNGYHIAADPAIAETGYLNGNYVEGEGYKSTGAYMFTFNLNVAEWVLKGYTKVRARFIQTATLTSGIYNNATYSNVYSNKFNSAASRGANTYELEFDISARTSTEYLGFYFSGNGGTLTDLWFEKEALTIQEAYKIDKKYDWITQDQKETIVTIPVNGWEPKSDGANTYYEREIEVPKMYKAYTGCKDTQLLQVDPINMALQDIYKDEFLTIYRIDSYDGKIKVILTELPTIPFDIIFYGLGQ